MEIIQTFTWEESEVYVISDGSSLHLVDEGDVNGENLGVGSSVRSSDIGDKYMEIPISILEEMNRRAQVFVEPESEEDSSDDEDNDEEEDAGPPAWEPLAIEKFLSEHIALREGQRCTISLDVSVFDDFDATLSPASKLLNHDWDQQVGAIVQQNAGYLALRENIANRIRVLDRAISNFVEEQNELGHSSLGKEVVYRELENARIDFLDSQNEAA